jgi:hypothetical protein
LVLNGRQAEGFVGNGTIDVPDEVVGWIAVGVCGGESPETELAVWLVCCLMSAKVRGSTECFDFDQGRRPPFFPAPEVRLILGNAS